MDITLTPDKVKTLTIFLLGKDLDNLREPERKELARSAVHSVSELNELVRGEPDQPEPSLRVIG